MLYRSNPKSSQWPDAENERGDYVRVARRGSDAFGGPDATGTDEGVPWVLLLLNLKQISTLEPF